MIRDALNRPLHDLRISVTDRCNFRCTYCMPKEVFGAAFPFLPRSEVLSFEEITRLARLFVAQGVEKLRLTGGEPLVRRNIMWLIGNLGRQIERGALDELTLTTNGSQLARYAGELRDCGVRRVNVSVDTLDPARIRLVGYRDPFFESRTAKECPPRLILNHDVAAGEQPGQAGASLIQPGVSLMNRACPRLKGEADQQSVGNTPSTPVHSAEPPPCGNWH